MRVVIVGPSPCIQGLNMGPIIDSYDIVCRVNQSYMCALKYPDCYGRRNDIQFFANNHFISDKILRMCKPPTSTSRRTRKSTHPFTKTTFYAIGKHDRLISRELKHHIIYNRLQYKIVQNTSHYLKTTGISSCLEILKWKNVTELFVVGFSFHNEASFYTDNLVVEPNFRFHDESDEKNTFRKMLEHPSVKVTAHETTMKALEEERQSIAPRGNIQLTL